MLLTSAMDHKDLAQKASAWCEKKIVQYHARSLFLPAGQTPVPLYQYWEKTRPSFLRGLKFVQLDEILPGPATPGGQFREFFENNLPSFISQMEWVHDSQGMADLAMLGFGVNGHVAFHEPSVPPDFLKGEVTLSDETCHQLGIDPPTRALTHGIGAFLKTRAVLLMVWGESKRAAYQKFLKRDPSIPASALVQHPDLEVLSSF